MTGVRALEIADVKRYPAQVLNGFAIFGADNGTDPYRFGRPGDHPRIEQHRLAARAQMLERIGDLHAIIGMKYLARKARLAGRKFGVGSKDLPGFAAEARQLAGVRARLPYHPMQMCIERGVGRSRCRGLQVRHVDLEKLRNCCKESRAARQWGRCYLKNYHSVGMRSGGCAARNLLGKSAPRSVAELQLTARSASASGA